MIHRFTTDISEIEIPDGFYDPYAQIPHEIAQIAAREFHIWLKANKKINSYFSINNKFNKYGKGKMMGVMVVEEPDTSIGFLAGFSGKLIDSNHHQGFVPPIYDALNKNGFVSIGLNEVKLMTARIHSLKVSHNSEDLIEAENIIKHRKQKTQLIQEKLYREYSFLDASGISKGLYEIFESEKNPNPPSGSGECAAPKMIQYAYQNSLRPIAIAEFWWGLPSLSGQKKHTEYYPPCQEKCRPILRHMLNII